LSTIWSARESAVKKSETTQKISAKTWFSELTAAQSKSAQVSEQ
jgi:hypothetical protein